MRRYAIVGSGAAGLAAAEALRECDATAEISMFGPEAGQFYSKPGLAYYLANAIPEKQLAIRSRQELRELAVDYVSSAVVDVLPREHEVHAANGRSYSYDRLLLATGAASIELTVPGAQGTGVFYLDNRQDAAALVEATKAHRNAVVVGGGPTAVELAEGLHARGMNVSYFLRGARYWPGLLAPAESAVVQDALVHAGIAIRYNTAIAEVLRHQGQVTGVVTQAGHHVACEVIAAAIGVAPRIELAQRAGIAVQRGILCDRYFRTSAQDIYTAGDCAEHTDGLPRDALWSAALAQGKVAGQNMADRAIPYPGKPSLNVTRLGGVIITIVGAIGPGAGASEPDLIAITRGDSESWRKYAVDTAFESIHSHSRVRVAIHAGRVSGAVIVNDAAASRAIVHLVRESVDIESLMPELERDAENAIKRLVDWGTARIGDLHAANT